MDYIFIGRRLSRHNMTSSSNMFGKTYATFNDVLRINSNSILILEKRFFTLC